MSSTKIINMGVITMTITNKCRVPNCRNTIKVKKHSLCKTHSNRLYCGKPMEVPIIKRKKPRIFNAYNK